MPTRNITLSPEMDQFVNVKIESGEYANATEVLCAGLKALEQADKEDQAKLEALRAAVQAGIDSGIALGDPVERVRARIRRRADEIGRLTA
jgi:antitoxin ParD1/3/4